MNEIKKIEKLLSDLAFNHMCLETTYNPRSNKDNKEYRDKMSSLITDYLKEMQDLLEEAK